MRRIFTALFALLLISSASVSAQQDIAENWDAKYTNGIAAVVNDRIITLEQVREYMAPLIPEVRRRARNASEFDYLVKQLARESIQNLVDRILVIEDFHDSEYKIPEAYLEAEFDDYITEEFGGDRAQFIEWLRQQGKTTRDFRKDLEEKIIVGFMRNRLRKNTSQISPERILEYYDEHKEQFVQEESIHLRQIVLAPYASESPSLLEQQAETIIRQVRADEAEFEDLARKYSQDNKAKEGGDWGWIKKGDLREELMVPAFELEAGEISEPIKIGRNIFILYVEDVREEGVLPLEDVRPQIEEAITAQLARNAQERWLERLRRKAYIRYFLSEAL